MAVSHVYSNTAADFTGTITGFNSQGSTVTIAATNLVRPSDWNSAHNQYFTLSGNTNNSSVVSGTNVVLSGDNNITLIGSGATIGISAAGGNHTYSYFNPQDAYMQVAGQQGQASLHFQPLQAPNVTFDRIVFPVVFSGATNSTASVTLSLWMGIYTRNDSTFSLSTSYSTSGAVTHSGTQNSSQNVGMKLLTIGATDFISEGQYSVGIVSRTTSGGANASVSQMLASQLNSNLGGFWGQAVNQTIQYTRGLGVYSATTSGIPNSVAISELRGTASLVLRQSLYYFVSGTF